MIREELKRMSDAASAVIRPWVLMGCYVVFAIICYLPLLRSTHLPTHVVMAMLGFACFAVAAGTVAVGINTLGLLVATKPLQLPSGVKMVAVRTLVLTGLLLIVPLVAILNSTIDHPAWIISILLCAHAVTLVFLVLPGWLSVVIMSGSMLTFSVYSRFLTELPLWYTDMRSTHYFLVITATLYIVAWLRIRRILKKHTYIEGIQNSVIELAANSKSMQVRTSYSIYGLIRHLFLGPAYLSTQNSLNKMRTIMGTQFTKFNFIDVHFLILLAIIVGYPILIGLALKGNHYLIMFSIFLMVINISSLHRPNLQKLLRHPSHELAELALLPGLATHQSLFNMLRRAVVRPIIQIGVITITLFEIALLSVLNPSTTLLLIVAASGVLAILLQWMRVIVSFAHAAKLTFSHAKLVWVLLQLICPWILIAFLNNTFLPDKVLGSSPFYLAATALGITFSILGFRWYHQLKALPHPFVER